MNKRRRLVYSLTDIKLIFDILHEQAATPYFTDIKLIFDIFQNTWGVISLYEQKV